MAYSQAVADEICRRLAEGESLVDVCRANGMPHRSTVHDWLRADAEFADRYARAKEDGLEVWAAEILAIANTPEIGQIRTVKPDGAEEVKHADMIEHRRLQIDARKWLLSKLAPKKYGERLQHTGADGRTLAQELAGLNGLTGAE